MNKHSTKSILSLILCCSASLAEAQQWLGRTTGNYAGTYGVYHNASAISDSRYKYHFAFWGRGANFYNNFLTYNAPIKLNHWANNRYDLQNQNSAGRADMQKDWLRETLNGRDKQFSFTQDIWGPAFMFPLSRRWNMSVNTRQRSGLQMYGISEEVARMIHNGLDSSGGIYSGSNPLSRNVSYHNNAFGVNMQSFQEISVTIGGIISRTEHHQVNFGATVKFLRGLGSSFIRGDEFNIVATGNNSASINGDIEYGYTDQKSVVDPFNRPYGLFSLQSKGAGGGVDLGFSYTYSSKRLKYPSACEMNARKSDYDFKLAMALNDLGAIGWGQGKVYAYQSAFNNNVTAPGSILDGFNIRNQNGFDTIGQQVFSQLPGTTSQSFGTWLPLAFNLQADFRLAKYLYTSVYWNQNLKGLNSKGLRTTSMLSVIPRIESRVFDFSIPLTLSENYKNFYVGAYTRIGPVFFGTDNLGGLLKVAANGEFTGADIYGGVTFGIGHCHKWWYKDEVDPVYLDSTRHDTSRLVEKDTIKVLTHDTIRVVKKDTVYIDKKTKGIVKRDTVYIQKPGQSKPDDKEILALRKQVEELKKQKSSQDSALLACKDCEANRMKNQAEIARLKDDITLANRKIRELETEIVVLKKRNTTVPPRGSDREKLERAQKQVDSLNVVVIVLRGELDNCKKNVIENNTELVKKAENDKIKAENEAKLLKKKNDSLSQVLVIKTNALDNCKKNSGTNNSELLKKAEADKVKAENEAKAAKRQSDSLARVLVTRTSELENCRKNSTLNNTELVKKLETEKTKAEIDAKTARREADSLSRILLAKNTELETCRKNAALYDAEVLKNKKCADENTMLKTEMTEMSKTISKLNTKIYTLTYKVDSLTNELKNCNKSTPDHSNDAELLKKCRDANAELNAEIERLKTVIGRRNTSLDSMESISGNLLKKQSELQNQVNRLNTELEDLKTKAGTSNCDELQKQLDEKNSEINKLKTDGISLQNKINSLNNQLSELKVEYNFMVKQNQRCNQKLDSCVRGLNHTEPIDKGPGEKEEGKGPNPGSPSMGNSNSQAPAGNTASGVPAGSNPANRTGSGSPSAPTEQGSRSNNTSGGNSDRNSQGTNTGSTRR